MNLERINLLCALKGISQSKLASDLGISKQALNNYIKGKNAFNDVVRLGILRYFDLPEKIFTQNNIKFMLKGDYLTIDLFDVVDSVKPYAYEFHNYETGHCYVDYVELEGMSENEGYTKIPLIKL